MNETIARADRLNRLIAIRQLVDEAIMDYSDPSIGYRLLDIRQRLLICQEMLMVKQGYPADLIKERMAMAVVP